MLSQIARHLPILLLLLAGCSRAPAPAYPRENALWLRDLFHSLQAGKHEVAVGQLRRLEEVLPEAIGLATLRRDLQDDLTIDAVNAALADGELDGAIAILREAQRRDGMSGKLSAAQADLEALEHLADFRRRGPPADVARLEAAVARLPSPTLFTGAERERYERWYRAQTAGIEAQVKRLRELAREQEKRQRELKLEQTAEKIGVSLAMGRDARTVEPLIAELAREAVAHPLVVAWEEAGRTATPAPALAAVADPRLREIVAFVYFYGGRQPTTAATRQQLSAVAGEAKGLTLCGLFLRTEAAFRAGDVIGGLAALRHLQELAPEADLERLLPAIPTPAPGVAAPTPGTLLQRLYDAQSGK